MIANIQRLLLSYDGKGVMSNTAYDTAWIARLGEIDTGLSHGALDWICHNQLPDGSWGVERPLYYHDRIISSLAAMIALTQQGRRSIDKKQVERGLLALEFLTSVATRGLAREVNGATAGFELIVPTLVAEAERLGIITQQGERILGRLKNLRTAKLQKLKGYKIDKHITTALSAEMAGLDHADLLDGDNLQQSNGSIGNSPSATAYYVTYLHPENQGALHYLRQIIRDGGAPFIAPFENFEKIWLLWNVIITGQWDQTLYEACRSHVDYLESNWRPGRGISFSAGYLPEDGDDTALGYKILKRFDRKPHIEDVLAFEEADHFRCFQLEATLSTDVNIHVLEAFEIAGLDRKHPSVKKAINFIRKTRIDDYYWLDKWHASPYYTTSHAIIACRHYDKRLCDQSVNWLVETQKKDGSWGFYRFSTAEETAYCLQALSLYRRSGGKFDVLAIRKGYEWLVENAHQPYPSLWIGKSLYCPRLLVEIAIASALALARD